MPREEVEWRVLTPDTLFTDGMAVALQGRPRAVLLSLLLQPNEVVSTDRIVDRLWGDDPPKTARNSVARFVADIRRALGPLAERLRTEDHGYRIVVETNELDLDVVIDRLASATAARETDPDDAIVHTREALDVFGNPADRPLDVLHDIEAETRRHEELRVTLIELNAELELRQGRHQALVPELEFAVEHYPFHEQLWALLMRALYRSNRQADALRAYQRLSGVLEEIGLQPAPPLRRLEAEILAQLSVDGSDEDEPLGPEPDEAEPVSPQSRSVSTTASRHGLAAPRTSLVGRTDEARAINDAIASNRLVSIVGIGGSGKTRMALAAAAAAESRGVDVHTLSLRAITDQRLLVSTLGAVLGTYSDLVDIEDQGSLVRNIGARDMLIVLDNCESILEPVATLVDAILDGAPNTRVLVTSREPLRLDGEFVYRLAPLAVPEGPADAARSPAMTLLIERARAQANWLDPDPDTFAALSDLCRALDGLPLAIELAAVQLAHLSAGEVLEQVRSGGARHLVDARGSAALAGVLDWAWESLTSTQQALLARLSVFGGTCSLDAVEAVSGTTTPVRDDLAELISKSLVSMTPLSGRARYSMLETVRDMAAAKLSERDETEATQSALASWLLDFTGQWSIPEIENLSRPSEAIAAEHQNLPVALQHLLDVGRREEALALATRCSGYWNHFGFPSETIRWLAPLAADESLPTETRSGAAWALAGASNGAGDILSNVEWALRSLDLADGRLLPWVPTVAAYAAMIGMTVTVPHTWAELLATAHDEDRDPIAGACADIWEATAEMWRLDNERALELFRAARRACDEPGRVLMYAEMGEAVALVLLDRYDEALEATRAWKSDAATDEWHYVIDVARAIVRAHAGEAEEASAELSSIVESLQPASVVGRAADFQVAFGFLAFYRGELDLSERLLATPLPHQPMVAFLMVRHIAMQRGVDDEMGWFGIVAEVMTRLPDGTLTGAPSGKLSGIVAGQSPTFWSGND